MTRFAAFDRYRSVAMFRAVMVLAGAIAVNSAAAADQASSQPGQVPAQSSATTAAGGKGGIRLERPGQRDFIVDRADLIAPPDRRHIRQIATRLLNDKATPIIVVTVESLAAYGETGVSIETFAERLFDQWGIGHAQLEGQPWNTGILLLVSRDDRQARIELGAGWKHEQDGLARQIMDEQIVPRFGRGDLSGGITAGVEALDKMARGLALPEPPGPWWQYLAGALFAWGVFFSVVLSMFRSIAHRSEGSAAPAGAGGFSGGSLGDGTYGGGGATGSW